MVQATTSGHLVFTAEIDIYTAGSGVTASTVMAQLDTYSLAQISTTLSINVYSRRIMSSGQDSSSDKGIPVAIIAGASAGATVLTAFVVLAVVLCCVRSHRKKPVAPEDSAEDKKGTTRSTTASVAVAEADVLPIKSYDPVIPIAVPVSGDADSDDCVASP
jgi:hypothetical protein